MLRLLLPLSPQVHDLLDRVFKLTVSERISIQDFRLAISQISSFAIPANKRGEFHDHQRAVWNTVFGPTSSFRLSTDIVRNVPIISPLGEEGVDITDAAEDRYKRSAKKASCSFIHRIPIIDTSPEALRVAAASFCSSPTLGFRTTSSSGASSNSPFPVTPQMVATMEDVDIIDISDIQEDILLPRSASPLTKLADTSMSVVTTPFQNILRMLRAL